MAITLMVPIWIAAAVVIELITWRAALWSAWQRLLIALACALLGWVANPIAIDPTGAAVLVGGLWLAFVVQLAVLQRHWPPAAAPGPRRRLNVRWIWPQPRYASRRQATTARYGSYRRVQK